MTAYLAVLFDVDETLYDRTRAQPMILRNIMAQLPELFAGQAEEEVFAAYERSDALTAEHGLPRGSIRASRNWRTRIFLEELGLSSEAAVEAVTEQYVAAYRCVDTPIDGAVQVVEGCARNHRVGVISNAFSDVQLSTAKALEYKAASTLAEVLAEWNLLIRPPSDTHYQNWTSKINAADSDVTAALEALEEALELAPDRWQEIKVRELETLDWRALSKQIKKVVLGE